MTNWVVRIEANMESCPTALEIEEEAKKLGITPVELWKERVNGKLDTKVLNSNSHPQS